MPSFFYFFKLTKRAILYTFIKGDTIFFFYPIMRTFITGATGFVGANLANSLVANGDTVHILTRPNSNLWRLQPIIKKLHCHKSNIQDKKAIEEIICRVKPEIIYHLSAYGTYHYQNDPYQIFQTAITGTLNLFLAAKKARVKIFVNTGSSSEYGSKNRPMKENEIPEPNSYYAVAKTTQTLLCRHFAKQEKMPIITLRLFSVYGEYEEPGRLIPTLIKKALTDQNLPLAQSNIARDFIYIKDVVRAFTLAAKRPDLTGQILNIGTGKQTTLKQIANKIRRLTDSQSQISYGQYEKRSFDTNIWLADTKKTISLLKFKPNYTLKQGLTNTVNWLKKNSHHY